MASEIPSLGMDAPTKLKVKSFEGDPPDFLLRLFPIDTDITIGKLDLGGRYQLSWTAGDTYPRRALGLTWDQLACLEGKGVAITRDGAEPTCAKITFTSMGPESDSKWRCEIEVEVLSISCTPTTGTFIAQDSSGGGDGEPGFVKST